MRYWIGILIVLIAFFLVAGFVNVPPLHDPHLGGRADIITNPTNSIIIQPQR